jgi:hypothetical protein
MVKQGNLGGYTWRYRCISKCDRRTAVLSSSLIAASYKDAARESTLILKSYTRLSIHRVTLLSPGPENDPTGFSSTRAVQFSIVLALRVVLSISLWTGSNI